MTNIESKLTNQKSAEAKLNLRSYLRHITQIQFMASIEKQEGQQDPKTPSEMRKNSKGNLSQNLQETLNYMPTSIRNHHNLIPIIHQTKQA